mmetsp:Transcript_1361/g.3762  ORF Transcript_1361/g.3762 Transcript_1361/m.3762 type:complete len:385 (+) Transcript_1361:10195-11349(+)
MKDVIFVGHGDWLGLSLLELLPARVHNISRIRSTQLGPFRVGLAKEGQKPLKSSAPLARRTFHCFRVHVILMVPPESSHVIERGGVIVAGGLGCPLECRFRSLPRVISRDVVRGGRLPRHRVLEVEDDVAEVLKFRQDLMNGAVASRDERGRMGHLSPSGEGIWPGEGQLDGELVDECQISSKGGETNVKVEDGFPFLPPLRQGQTPQVIQAQESKGGVSRIEYREVGRQALERPRHDPKGLGGALAFARVVQAERTGIVHCHDPRNGIRYARRAREGRGPDGDEAATLLDARRGGRVDAAHSPYEEEEVYLSLASHLLGPPKALRLVLGGEGQDLGKAVLRGRRHEGRGVLDQLALLQQEGARIAHPQEARRRLGERRAHVRE